MSEFKKPKAYSDCKVVAFVFLVIASICFVIGLGYGILNSQYYDKGIIIVFIAIGAFFGVLSIIMFIIAFGPERRRMFAKYDRYRQNETKDIQSDIYTAQAEIKSEGIKTTVKAIKDGISGDDMFCKHCGERIDADSTFCKKCGKQQ